MDKFGFTLSKARVIDYDKNDRSIAEYILKHEPSLRACIECGACTATCTAGNFTEFSLREFNILVKRGENDKILHKLKRCMLCGKCVLVCPRGVNTRNVIFLARKAFRSIGGYEL